MVEAVREVQDFAEFTTLGHYLITYMPSTRWTDNDKRSEKSYTIMVVGRIWAKSSGIL